jgi:hypothetical protein
MRHGHHYASCFLNRVTIRSGLAPSSAAQHAGPLGVTAAHLVKGKVYTS